MPTRGDGRLTIEACTFVVRLFFCFSLTRQNHSTGGDRAGGLFLDSVNADIRHSSFSRSAVLGPSGDGGHIFMTSSIARIDNCTFSDANVSDNVCLAVLTMLGRYYAGDRVRS